jgi:S1-C subfamily serine protease
MKKGLVSMIAAASLAMGVGGSGSGCAVVVESAKVHTIVGERERSVRQDLEDIARSVFCVRNTIKYRRVGAGLDEKPLERTIYGTATAYANHHGSTYLVTNNHVAKGDDTYHALSIVEVNGQLAIMFVEYAKMSDNITLVDNRLDKDGSDDVRAETVKSDKDVDIAVIKADADLHVAVNYIRHDFVQPKVWDKVYVIGYPKGLMKSRVEGRVSNTSLRLPNEKRSYHALDITGTFGNSGSSYFFRKGDQLYWGGVINAILPFPYTRSPMLGIPLKNFSDILAVAYSPSPVGRPRGET